MVSYILQLPSEILSLILPLLDPHSKSHFLSVLNMATSLCTPNDIYSTDLEGNSLIHFLALEGYTECLEVVLQGLTRIGIPNYNGENPLHLAVQKDQITTAELLIDIGIDINKQDNYGRTPLHIAVHSGRTKLARVLIESGASLSIPDQDGHSVLHIAAIQENVQMVQLLLTSGAEAKLQDSGGLTPLHWSALERTGTVAKLIIDSGSQDIINWTDANGLTPLHHAAYWGNYNMALVVLLSGCDPNHLTYSAWSAVHHAVQGGHVAVIQLLEQYGADLNLCGSFGVTPLDLAVAIGDDRVRTLLLRMRARRGALADGITPPEEPAAFHIMPECSS